MASSDVVVALMVGILDEMGAGVVTTASSAAASSSVMSGGRIDSNSKSLVLRFNVFPRTAKSLLVHETPLCSSSFSSSLASAFLFLFFVSVLFFGNNVYTIKNKPNTQSMAVDDHDVTIQTPNTIPGGTVTSNGISSCTNVLAG